MCVCTAGTDAGVDGGTVDAGMDAFVPLDAEMDAPANDGGADAADAAGGSDAGDAAVSGYVHVSAGRGATCATRFDGRGYCWGAAIDDSNPPYMCAPHPVALAVTGVTAMSTDGPVRCGLATSGAVQCFGPGIGGTGTSTTPMVVPGVTSVAQFALGGGAAFACAGRTAGNMLCYGDNASGQLGNGSTTPSMSPVFVSGLSTVASIGVGGTVACAVRIDGTLACWGRGMEGELGSGATANALSPLDVAGETGVTEVDVGAAHVCAVHADGHLSCWGGNDQGQVGNGALGGNVLSPVTIAGLTNVVHVSAGGGTTCAVLATGAVTCWGYNSVGQVGDGTFTSRATPTAVVGISDAVAVSVGDDHVCAIRRTGRIWCWGGNMCGQLGDDTAVGSATPEEVTALP